LFTDLGNYKIIKEPKYALKTETETATELRLVVGIETPLDIISIALQNGRESNQEGLSKYKASATPPLIKDKMPQVPSIWTQRIQEFKEWMRMPEGTESV